MIKVCLIEDHAGLREDVVFGLNSEGLVAQGVESGAEFDRFCLDAMPEVVVIDWMLPGEDGLSIARRISLQGERRMGVIMLTARGGLEDRVEGLNLVDAYLVKPVDIRELAAVIRSVYRRLDQKEKVCDTAWRLLESRLELVSPQGVVIPLSHREFIALVFLVDGNGKCVQARAIAEAFGEDWLLFEKNRLELLFSRLRQKIASVGGEAFNPIKSVRNQGYLLTIPVVVDAQDGVNTVSQRRQTASI